MNITMTLFAYALSDDLIRAWQSIRGENVTIHLFLHSQFPAVVKACEHIVAQDKNVVYHAYGYNRGVARGINDTISAAWDTHADLIICWADDMFARPGDIERIAQAVLNHPDCSYVASPCWVEKTQRDEYTGMALGWKAIKKIGYFDVNCHPLAFGDVDWIYRAKLAGMERFIAEDTYLIHGGAKTRDAMPEAEGEFMQQFGAARDYYTSKWGGDYQKEIFTCPFNNPKYDCRIIRRHADNPYPEYSRADVILSR